MLFFVNQLISLETNNKLMKETENIKKRIKQLNHYAYGIKQQIGALGPIIENTSNSINPSFFQEIPKINNSNAINAQLEMGTQRNSLKVKNQQDQQNDLLRKIAEVGQKIQEKKMKLGLERDKYNKHHVSIIERLSRVSPLEIQLYITQLNISSCLQQQYLQVIENEGQSQYFKKYLLYIHYLKNVSPLQSQSQNNKKIPSNHHRPTIFQLIFVNRDNYTIIREDIMNIVQGSVVKFNQIIHFRVRAMRNYNGEIYEVNYLMKFGDSDKIQLWYCYLKELEQIVEHGEYLQKKWIMAGIKIRGKNQEEQIKPIEIQIPQIPHQQQKNHQHHVSSHLSFSQKHKIRQQLMAPFTKFQKKIDKRKKSDHSKNSSKKSSKRLGTPSKSRRKITFFDEVVEAKKEENQEDEEKKNVIEEGKFQRSPGYSQLQVPSLNRILSSPGSIHENTPKIIEKLSEKKKLLQLSNKNKEIIFWEQQIKSGHSHPNQFQLLTIEGQSRKNSHATNKSTEKNRLELNRPSKLSINSEYFIRKKNDTKHNTETRVPTPSNQDLDSKDSQSNSNIEEKKQSPYKLKRLYTREQTYIKNEGSFRSLREGSESEHTISPTKRKKKYREQLKTIKESEVGFIRDKGTGSDPRRSKQQTVISRKSSQKKEKNLTLHRKSKAGLSFIDQNNNNNNDEDQIYEQASSRTESELSSSDESELQKLAKLELKNGIVLWKYAAKGWAPHQKKLFLSSNELYLCYSDIKNDLDQKKIIKSDILEVKYGHFDKGIIAHRKANIDRDRCLTITYQVKTKSDYQKKQKNQSSSQEKKKKKIKVLEFMLSDTEPVYNLKSFSEKLWNCIQQ